MIPLALNPAAVRIGLAGAGAPLARRLAALRAGGAAPVLFAAGAVPADVTGALPFPPDAAALDSLQVLYLAGLTADQYEPLARAARGRKILVNVEDVPEFCDFHAAAEIRRGDLLVTVSTGGAAPGLAAIIRKALEDWLAPAWAERVAEIGALRRRWRAEGLPMAEAAERMAGIVRERCWLPTPRPD
jgi:precorrin-2 dehydrogenase/sirohydrochlorin ferrochelatase